MAKPGPKKSPPIPAPPLSRTLRPFVPIRNVKNWLKRSLLSKKPKATKLRPILTSAPPTKKSSGLKSLLQRKRSNHHMSDQIITCPHCKNDFPLSEVFKHQIEEEA